MSQLDYLNFVCFRSFNDEAPIPVATFLTRDDAIEYCYQAIKKIRKDARKKLHVFYMEKPSPTEKYSYLKDIMFCKKKKFYAGVLRDNLIADLYTDEATLFEKDKRKF